jgi:hypothetical protein
LLAPLAEHLQPLLLSGKQPEVWQFMTLNLGPQRQTLEAEETMAGVMMHDDLCCEAQRFVSA